MKVLQSSEYVTTAERSADGTLFVELVTPNGIQPPWHPDPKSPRTFAVLRSQTKEGRTELTFRVLWVAGEQSGTEYRRYVEGVLAKLQAAVIAACASQTGG